jgi:hypothetical protein
VEPYAAAPVDAATVTFNPGEGLWLYNPWTTNVTLTFVGTVLTGSVTNSPANALTNVMGTGFQIVSSMVPVAGAVDAVFGIVPATQDSVFIWDTNATAYDQFTWTKKGVWSPAGPPTVAVGQAFWYEVSTGTNNWVENFSVSQ